MYCGGYSVLPFKSMSSRGHLKSPLNTSFSFILSIQSMTKFYKYHLFNMSRIHAPFLSPPVVQAIIISHLDHNIFPISLPASVLFLIYSPGILLEHSVLCIPGGQRQWLNMAGEALHSQAPHDFSNLVSHHPLPQSAHWPHWPAFTLLYLPCSFPS